MQDEPVSKSKRKRDMLELQALGIALLDLPPLQREALGLPERLADALRAAVSISSHEGRRRQLQYVGRLMRDVDPESIRDALNEVQGRSAAAQARHRQLEQWRERLLASDDCLTEFAREHAAADLQALRTLIRNARRELAEGRPPQTQRELFRRLRETLA